MTTTNYRQFGLEIECFHPTTQYGASGRNIEQAIQGMGYPSVLSYRHFDDQYDKWQIKPDSTVATLNYPGRGLEVVSPTLPGSESSLTQVHSVAKWLAGNGYDVDSSCGFHIHIDAGDLSSYECAAVALRYHHRQAEINEIMPSSRHHGNCRWAQGLNGAALSKVSNTVSSKNRTVRWTEYERYVAVNLQHVAKARSQRRIEFRQHSGTVNAAKIIGWYKFLCDFVAETLRILREGGSLVGGETVTTQPIIRRQRTRRGETRSVVVGTSPAPRIPAIDIGTDYDLFLRRLCQNGVITTDDAREFGWMNGGTNSTNSRLRVTAHWLRRHGAELITTQRNGELAYVGPNDARTREAIFTAPAQIRTRVEAARAASPVVAPITVAPSSAQRELILKLANTSVLENSSDETKAWFNARRLDIAASRRP